MSMFRNTFRHVPSKLQRFWSQKLILVFAPRTKLSSPRRLAPHSENLLFTLHSAQQAAPAAANPASRNTPTRLALRRPNPSQAPLLHPEQETRLAPLDPPPDLDHACLPDIISTLTPQAEPEFTLISRSPGIWDSQTRVEGQTRLLFTHDVDPPNPIFTTRDLDPVLNFFNGRISSLLKSNFKLQAQLSPRKLCCPTTRAHASLFTSHNFTHETRSSTNQTPRDLSSDIPFRSTTQRGERRLRRTSHQEARSQPQQESGVVGAKHTRDSEGKMDVSAPRVNKRHRQGCASSRDLSPPHLFPVSCFLSCPNSMICTLKLSFLRLDGTTGATSPVPVCIF